jgi:predicted CXXCH cytochrome family protein
MVDRVPLRRFPREAGRWTGVALCFLGCVAGALSLVSCATVSRTIVAPPDIPGATYVGNAACADCHAEITRIFPASPHARVHVETAALRGQTGCESCHGPGSRHVANPYARGERLIVNPRKDADGCYPCHVGSLAEFRLPHHHPVAEGRVSCVQCHDPHGSDIRKAAGGLAMARLNEACAGCHREQAKPFVFEHEAMREGCVTCHHPHGSVNRRLLTEPDSNLCLRCHAQTQGPGVGGAGQIYIGKVAHTGFLSLGGCWTAGCHTAVHGSNVSPKMFY